MRLIKLLLFFSGLFVLTGTASMAETPPSDQRVTAYYFHNTVRCPSCTKIEQYTEETIKSAFSKELEEGILVWKSLNLDEEENKDFIDKYSLFTKSVILSKDVNGEEVKWKNLDKVWHLLGDEGAFKTYIQEQVSGFFLKKEEQ